MPGLVGLAVGHVSLAIVVVVVGRGVNATVVRSPLVEVGVRVHWVAEATPAAPLSSGDAVEPALVAVAAGGVTGQGVTAGVAGVLSLALRRTRPLQSGGNLKRTNTRRCEDKSDL